MLPLILFCCSYGPLFPIAVGVTSSTVTHQEISQETERLYTMAWQEYNLQCSRRCNCLLVYSSFLLQSSNKYKEMFFSSCWAVLLPLHSELECPKTVYPPSINFLLVLELVSWLQSSEGHWQHAGQETFITPKDSGMKIELENIRMK